jgi:hypothetical protein
MKKLIALLLTLALVFSFTLVLTSCGDGGDEDSEETCKHVDNDKDNKCDKCGKKMSAKPDKKPGDITIDTEKGAMLSNAIIAQINAAASVKLSMDLSITGDVEEWYYDYNSGDAICDKDHAELELNATVTVSKSDSGVNAKLDVAAKTRNDVSEDFDVFDEFTAVYLVDGVIYAYDHEFDAYVQQEIPMPDAEDLDEITAVLEQLMAGITLPGEDEINAAIEEIKGFVGGLLISIFDINEGAGGGFVIDAKPTIDAIKEFVASLDGTTTVEMLINDLLRFAEIDITVADICDEIKSLMALTVNEALAEIDAFLTKEADTTLQGLYDSIVKDPTVVQLSKNMLELQGMPADEIEEIITMIQSMNIADMIEAYGIGDLTLIDLFLASNSEVPENHYDSNGDGYCDDCKEPVDIYEMMSANDAIETPVVSIEKDELIDSLFEEVNAFLNLTLADVDKMIADETGIYVLAMIKEIVGDLVVNDMKSSVNINFSSGYNVSEIVMEEIADFVVKIPSAVEGKKDVTSARISLEVKLHSISANEIEIALPADAVILVTNPNQDVNAAKANLEANGYLSVAINDISESSSFDGALYSLCGISPSEELNYIYYFENEAMAEEAYFEGFADTLYKYAEMLDINPDYIGYTGNTVYIASPEFIYATNTVFPK